MSRVTKTLQEAMRDLTDEIANRDVITDDNVLTVLRDIRACLVIMATHQFMKGCTHPGMPKGTNCAFCGRPV